ncbi:FtsQ-type POTRA domain-containing protein [Petroclostridium sp. X23]|jgi:cell division septal protein FtsQ|uniref:cell division protein FtsQ/DivIB n=1 Tax=Petroclostridium sp. X23 TaxID=3045146 RepID=UPI0024AE3818|nr:FtsQ-type POTRA domain-containing protein [Petroclostridium sp. X23]WHH58894.1 FtsQ-type POTRA domain-containing protein [Petroclostridium sp. X23]
MKTKYNSSGNFITTTQYNQKPDRKKRRTSRKFFVIILLVIAIVLASFFSPIFNISDIKVAGTERISAEDIIVASGIEKGMNIFQGDLTKAKRSISQMPYVDSIKISRVLPNKIKINIEERKPVGYIPFMGSYIFIDGKGNVLEVVSQLENNSLPVIMGLKFSQFKLGEKIKVDEENKLQIVVSCVQEIISNKLLDKVVRIDVHDINSIRLNIENRVDVNVGDEFGLRYKMNFLNAILTQIEPKKRGFIDLNVDKPIFSAEE